MKKVLSLLVAFVFLQVQSWALSGGPVYGAGGNGNPSIIGTYGGVLIPTSQTPAPTSIQPPSIGVFSIAVPETGLSAGVAIIFVNGVAFLGQIAGMGDVDNQSIQGLIGGTSSFQIKVGANTFSVFAQGSFEAKVIAGDAGAFTTAPAGSGNGTSSSSGSSSTSAANKPSEIGSTNSARLQGSAQIGTFFTFDGTTGSPNIDVIVNYSLDGIKQNNIPNTVTTVPFTFGSGS